MDSNVTYALIYWALSGFICAELFANVNEHDLNQRPDDGWQTPLVRWALYFVFGGAILPMIVLIGAAINGAALGAWLAAATHSAERASKAGESA
jgi:hypothetical protein